MKRLVITVLLALGMLVAVPAIGYGGEIEVQKTWVGGIVPDTLSLVVVKADGTTETVAPEWSKTDRVWSTVVSGAGIEGEVAASGWTLKMEKVRDYVPGVEATIEVSDIEVYNPGNSLVNPQAIGADFICIKKGNDYILWTLVEMAADEVVRTSAIEEVPARYELTNTYETLPPSVVSTPTITTATSNPNPKTGDNPWLIALSALVGVAGGFVLAVLAMYNNR